MPVILCFQCCRKHFPTLICFHLSNFYFLFLPYIFFALCLRCYSHYTNIVLLFRISRPVVIIMSCEIMKKEVSCHLQKLQWLTCADTRPRFSLCKSVWLHGELAQGAIVFKSSSNLFMLLFLVDGCSMFIWNDINWRRNVKNIL